MAWRPSEYVIEGELDNTQPGRVTGWMQFAGMTGRVTFDLKGNFHRDIRGAKIRFRGDGVEGMAETAAYMAGFALKQTGDTGDITAGREPRDYVAYPYLEWYSKENGRVVVELDQDQVLVIGRPIPACESDPIPREQQAQHMARFLADVSNGAGVLAIAPGQRIQSDPSFSHWVIKDDRIIGEAREVQPTGNGSCLAYVRLFGAPDMSEYGSIQRRNLRAKDDPA
jgi:hypothetical protein